MDIIGFNDIDCMWLENGKQDQQHIHAIIKKKMPNEEAILKMSKVFKQKKLKWFEYGEAAPGETIGAILVHKMNTSHFGFHLSEIKDQQHFNELKYEYRWKELDPDFLD